MPTRLLELVRKYPYTQGLSSPTTDLRLLPRSHFTTSLYDALFVRIEFEYPTESRKPKSKIQLLNVLADAFSANVEDAAFAALWSKITAASKNGSDSFPLSNIFADETIRFLSFVSRDKGKEKEPRSPTFSLFPLSRPTSPIKRSFSIEDKASSSTAADVPVHKRSATGPALTTPISPLPIGGDWAQFSSSGFLDSSPAIAPLVSTLFDTDVEKTVPPDPPASALSRRPSKRAKTKSVEMLRTVAIADSLATEASSGDITTGEESGPTVKATKLEIIQFDETFVDFWSDSLLDPITSKWPTFIICKFKPTLVPQLTYGDAEEGKPQKTLKWLVLEHVSTVKPPPPAPVVVLPTVDHELTEVARPSSPAPSTSGKKRFMFWSLSRSASSSSATSTGEKEKEKSRKKDKTPKVGEMGELIEEEGGGEKPSSSLTKNRKTVDLGKKLVDEKRKTVDEGKESSDQKPVVEQLVEVSSAVVAAVGVVATGTVLATVSGDQQERVEGEKALVVKDADVKVVSASEAAPIRQAEPVSEAVLTSETEVAAAPSEPISNDAIAELRPVSWPVIS